MYVMPGALGLSGRGRAGAHGDRRRSGLDHRPPEPDAEQRARLRVQRPLPLRGSAARPDTLNGAWGFVDYDLHFLPIAVLMGMTFFMLVILLVMLKRRDPV